MTRRRLFGYLCLSGFLLVAGMWWFSQDRYSSVMISTPGGTASIHGKLFYGKAAIGVNPSYGSAGSWFTAREISFGGMDEELAGYYADRISWTHYIGFVEEDMRVMLGGMRPHHSYVYHYLYLPLWMIYLAFVVITFLILRPMRKQRLPEKCSGGL